MPCSTYSWLSYDEGLVTSRVILDVINLISGLLRAPVPLSGCLKKDPVYQNEARKAHQEIPSIGATCASRRSLFWEYPSCLLIDLSENAFFLQKAPDTLRQANLLQSLRVPRIG